MKHQRRDKKRSGNRNGQQFFEMPLLLLRCVSVHDLHFFKGRNVPDRPFQRLIALVRERDALSDKVDGHFRNALQPRKFFLQFRRAGRAVEIADLDDLFH